jgi:thioredoxin reductase
MDSWISHMPKGMQLKSDGFASNIYDPNGEFTLRQFCSERGIQYADLGLPVRLDTFSEYGLAFKERMVPELEDKQVVNIESVPGGFSLTLDDGQTVTAKRVVLAVGITHFEYLPAGLQNLPSEYVTHSFRHHDVESFRGRSVTVVGGGSSAIDLVGILHENGANAQIVARQEELKFHANQGAKSRTLWKRIRHPKSGLGPGMKSRFFADLPLVFHYLPESFRLESVRTHLGPAGGWFSKEKVVGRVPLLMGSTIERTEIRDGKVHMQLRSSDGKTREVITEHVIAATGYKVDLDRLKFLTPEIRANIKSVNKTPILSSNFESSVKGLYFVGIAAANSFGPLMRFAYGAGFAAKRVTRAMVKAMARNTANVPAAGVVTSTQ